MHHLPVSPPSYGASMAQGSTSVSHGRPREEVKLFSNTREREKYDQKADLFSIIKTTDCVEKAYMRDWITPKEYEPHCQMLIGKCRTMMDMVKAVVPDVDQFMMAHGMMCAAGKHRLFKAGVPATIEHGGKATSEDSSRMAQYIAQTVQHFITLMDSLKLNMVAVDEIHPLLNDLMDSLNKITTLPPDFAGKVKCKEWLSKMNAMRASDNLTEDDVRQLLFDLDNSYNAFHRSLSQ